MAGATLEQVKRALWPHQVAGVELVQRYLRAKNGPGSALIRLPTGTGKTGVMATAALLLARNGIVVIVAPSKALCAQICDELRADFWRKLNLQRPRPRTPVEPCVATTVKARLDAWPQGRGVLVATAQSLARLRSEQDAVYHRLASRTVLVMFDEGHREPAPQWGEACRGLKAPTVLFSATPYRNDYALFDVSKEFVQSFSFHNALRERCVRDVEVQQVLAPDAKRFVDRVWQALADYGEHSRAIIRCDSHRSIVEVMEALRCQNIPALAIHERFTAKDGKDVRSSVPADKDAIDARIWVHQNKLLEGIDDPRFTVVALYNSFGSARALVQQVGRVIRNPTGGACKPALLLVRDQRQADFWANYLAYERNYAAGQEDARDALLEAVSSRPAYQYVEGNYCKLFDPRQSGFESQLRFRKAANIYRIVGEGVATHKLGEQIVQDWTAEQRIVLNAASPNPNTVVILYADRRNSPILRAGYYMEDRLGFTVVHRCGKWLFYYDSLGLLSDAVRSSVAAVPAARMHHLYGQEARTTALSMKNSDVGRHSVRSRSIRAHSLADVATGLADHGYLCSTAQGLVPPDKTAARGVRRYIGVASGRLTESGPSELGLADFLAWAAHKAEILDQRSEQANAVFERFARHVEPPEDTTARHILLDIDEYMSPGGYQSVADGASLEIEDLALEVENGRFCVTANGAKFEVAIAYNENTQRYRLESKDLDQAFVCAQPVARFRRGIVAQMNIDQAFRVVPGHGWTIYTHGFFVAATSGVGAEAGSGVNLLRIFTAVPALGHTTSEKGGAGTASEAGWSDKSVFGLLDRCAAGREILEAEKLSAAMASFDVFVCDDMGKESADFMCASTKERRLVVIHAKHNNSKRSASALHDVCAQALKNLHVLQPYNDQPPPNFEHWGDIWAASCFEENEKNKKKQKKPIGQVRRIRRGGKKCDAWGKMAELRRDPETQREVWLVLGKTLQLDWLRSQHKQPKPAPEAVQAFYLLESLWSSVSAIGARLRVFTAASW